MKSATERALGMADGEEDELPAVTGAWANMEEVEVPADLPKPQLWRLIVLPVQPRKMSRGGIALPDVTRDNEGFLNYIGKVVAIGPLAGKKPEFEIPTPYGAPISAWNVKVGDWVVYGRYTGQKMEFRGVKFIVVNDDEILAVSNAPDGFRAYV